MSNRHAMDAPGGEAPAAGPRKPAPDRQGSARAGSGGKQAAWRAARRVGRHGRGPGQAPRRYQERMLEAEQHRKRVQEKAAEDHKPSRPFRFRPERRCGAQLPERVQLDDDQRQVVSASTARERAFSIRNSVASRGEAMRAPTPVPRAEVVPDTIAAGHEHVARAQLRDEMTVRRRVVLGTEAPHEDVGLGMDVGFFFGDFAAVHQGSGRRNGPWCA